MHPRLKMLKAGTLFELTSHILGSKAAGGPISIACSMKFRERVLGGTPSVDTVKKLRNVCKPGDFTFQRNRDVFTCRCVFRQEEIEDRKINTYTFFLKEE